ncbi:MAG: ATP-binding cassette domain-containing protein [Candidatus Lokiarchaeota archaeon]|nr:ATP-binding cassette domain-containing protein [Candidatus Lokiarchaeota archaeon]
MTCAIEVNHVNFRYEEFVMEDICMNLHRGEHKALIGLNGSGKTTLFKLILGLLEPLSGNILIFDRRLTRENLWEIRKDIGFLFQNPDDQLFAPTVWEDVAFGPRNLGLNEDEVAKRVEESLKFVGMEDYINRAVNQMSHGQAKRVALAGILAMQPKILLLDEAFTGLDFPMVQSIVEIISQLRREGISVLFTTHNRFFIENWADSVVAIDSGQIVFDGPTDQALCNQDVLRQMGNWDLLEKKMKETRL